MNKILPVLNEHTAYNLVDTALIAPTQIEGTDQVTTFIKFGAAVDFISIGHFLVDASAEEASNFVGATFRICDIVYEKDGMVSTEEIASTILTDALPINGNTAQLSIDSTIALKDGSIMSVSGKIDTTSASVIIHAIANNGVTPLGYKLGVTPPATTEMEEDGVEVDENITIQQRLVERLEIIEGSNQGEELTMRTVDVAGMGGAHSAYLITGFSTKTNASRPELVAPIDSQVIYFQNGPVPQFGRNGYQLEDLLLLCSHRLQDFQNNQFACAENQEALDHINAAILTLNKRTKARIARQVEGKNIV